MSDKDDWEVIYDMHDEWNAAHQVDDAECWHCDQPAILGTELCEEHLHEYTAVGIVEKDYKVEFWP